MFFLLKYCFYMRHSDGLNVRIFICIKTYRLLFFKRLLNITILLGKFTQKNTSNGHSLLRKTASLINQI